MEYRVLGETSLRVPRLSLGTVTFGREIDQAASFDVLDHAVSLGLNFLDTAEAYGGGQSLAARKAKGSGAVLEASEEMHSSELILGRWLAERPGMRGRVMLQTKVTPPLTRGRILTSIDASLGRLRTDYLDSFLLHAFDPGNPLEESLGALGEAVRAGKVRHVGCSNFSVEQLAAARGGVPRLGVAQFNYNLAVRESEGGLIPYCRREGVGVQTYSPLGAGFLTGKYLEGATPWGTRFELVPGHGKVYFHEEKFAVVRRLASLSERVGVPVAQLAVAWVLGNRDVDTVLIGARTVGQIDSAVAAMGIRFEAGWGEELFAGGGA